MRAPAISYGSACSITLRVTAAGITVLNEPVDLAVTAPICPTIGGCATCIEVTPSGATGACVSIVRTCGSDDPQHIELGCIPTFPLTHCLQCNCHGHGHCDSNNACVCDAGWSGTTCLDRPSMLDKCVTVHVGKDWAVCGRLSQDDCSVRATLTLDGNQVLARGIPVLQLAHTGTGSACISVGVCEACIVLSDVAINGALTAMTGRADVRVKCVASAQQPLGTFNAASDYKDIETRCFPVRTPRMITRLTPGLTVRGACARSARATAPGVARAATMASVCVAGHITAARVSSSPARSAMRAWNAAATRKAHAWRRRAHVSVAPIARCATSCVMTRICRLV